MSKWKPPPGAIVEQKPRGCTAERPWYKVGNHYFWTSHDAQQFETKQNGGNHVG